MFETGTRVRADTSCPFGRRFAEELRKMGINPETTEFQVVGISALHGNQIGYGALACCFHGVVIEGAGYKGLRLRRDLTAA